jgi:hypothetical protein
MHHFFIFYINRCVSRTLPITNAGKMDRIETDPVCIKGVLIRGGILTAAPIERGIITHFLKITQPHSQLS